LNKVQLLVDADEIFPYVYNMISQAEESIHLEMYLLEGEIGQRVVDLMRQRANAGVKVRLIYQPSASIEVYNRIMLLFNRLGLKNRAISYIIFSGATNNENGIQVAPFPLGLFRRKASVKMAHNKVLIVDSKEAMVGGMNFGSITEHNHDVMVVVRGPIVQEMEKVFGYTWQLASGNRIISEVQDCDDGEYRKDQSDLVWVSYRITHPHLENTKSFLLQQIKEARKRILVEMYLFIDSELVSAIIEAAGKGLEVRVLLDGNPLPLDLDLHGFPNKRIIQRLMKANVPVRVFCCEPGQEMHMKVALLDDDKIVVGSTNWTKGSFTSNSESCFFYSK
jgi:phosphatidylserine/phosphatidylglycerophosphate/cardiolipin synthase-like enzyme